MSASNSLEHTICGIGFKWKAPISILSYVASSTFYLSRWIELHRWKSHNVCGWDIVLCW